jgi:hypothetical protein
VAHAHGWRVRSVGVGPCDAGITRWTYTRTEDLDVVMRKELEVVVAGACAHRLLLPGRDPRCSVVIASLFLDCLNAGGADLLMLPPRTLADVVAAHEGPSSDPCQAVRLARTLSVLSGRGTRPLVSQVVDWIAEAEARAREVLQRRKAALLRLARALDDRRELTGPEVRGLLG